MNDNLRFFIKRNKFRQEFFVKYSDELYTQLNNNHENPPIFLLLAVLILLLKHHKLAIHASGKFVGSLINFLVTENSDDNVRIPDEIFNSILEIQKFVVAMLKKKSGFKDEDEIGSHIKNISEFLTLEK